jgi:hypothetical protein
VLSTLVATLCVVTALGSFFYEGWGQGMGAAAGYMAAPALLIGACAIATRRPYVGGGLLLAGGAAAAGWWLWTRSASDDLTAAVVQTAVAFFGPVLLAGGLFLLEGRHRRLLAIEPARPSPGWWATNIRTLMVVGVPLLAAAVWLVLTLPDMLARHDDGLRGMRVIAGNGVTLAWAPKGPGWNRPSSNAGPMSSSAISSYGGTGAGLCGHLSLDGTVLRPEAVGVWRLPTVNEVIRSLTRGGANAGCTWDGRASHATCAQPPDKETPLWAPDEAPIYYLTSDTAGEAHVLGVNYTAGITPHRRTAASGGLGYRCVRPGM